MPQILKNQQHIGILKKLYPKACAVHYKVDITVTLRQELKDQ